MCNGDVLSYDDGIEKIVHPMNRASVIPGLTRDPGQIETTGFLHTQE